MFFIITSIYGWYRWHEVRKARGGGSDSPAITPRWATAQERVAYLVVSAAGVLVLQWVFSVIGAGWPAPRWYFWCDAWIFVGSMLATYAMARGWNDFWLAWIAVDLVGVPLLWHSRYYPTAILFVVYGVLVVWGFFVWLKASRAEHEPEPREGRTHERARRSGWTPSSRRSPTSRRARRSWSSTTRTARTRAT